MTWTRRMLPPSLSSDPAGPRVWELVERVAAAGIPCSDDH